MAHSHRYSVHMTSPCVKLTTSFHFLFLFFSALWTIVFRKISLKEAVANLIDSANQANALFLWSDNGANFGHEVTYALRRCYNWWSVTQIFGTLCCKALQSHVKVHVNASAICLYLLLHSLEECVLWPWHVQAGCMFPSRCTLTSTHELETLLLSSLSLSLLFSLVLSLSLSWLAHRTHWQQIPGRINARLNWINIIQTCSIPAGLS